MDSCFDIYKLGKVSLVVSSKIAQFLNCTYYNKSNDAHTHAHTRTHIRGSATAADRAGDRKRFGYLLVNNRYNWRTCFGALNVVNLILCQL